MARIPAWWPPSGSSTLFGYHLWFWRANIIAASYVFWFQRPLWNIVYGYYLVMVSLIALTGTYASGRQAAKAKEIASESSADNPDG